MAFQYRGAVDLLLSPASSTVEDFADASTPVTADFRPAAAPIPTDVHFCSPELMMPRFDTTGVRKATAGNREHILYRHQEGQVGETSR
jgi:hypothetical protein